MKILNILLVFLMFFSISSMAKEIVSKEIVSSQYGSLGDLLGFGDRTYKITYDDGTMTYETIKGNFWIKRLNLAAVLYPIKHPQTVTIIYKIYVSGSESSWNVISSQGYSRGETGYPSNTEELISMAIANAKDVMDYKSDVDTLILRDVSSIPYPGVETIINPIGISTPTSTSTPIPTQEILIWSDQSASVYINGINVGETSPDRWLTITKPSGSYTIKLTKDGYNTYTKKIMITNKSIKITAYLEKTFMPESTVPLSIKKTPVPTARIPDTPGFDAVLAIAGLLAVAYLVSRKEPINEKI